ncbi:aminopeptidase [Paenibacillus sp. J31TS4]|uniref:aminopeptidase n=1 Tax=Paenibacillus sp. J31TS4 TaxID=2807195 RepID=UPI001B1F233C|nr:aminopeptidase [Paenibacillus sp. J31TS4]GIP40399.1 aminopeptidase [Paenibacillus sp. J31TS4]
MSNEAASHPFGEQWEHSLRQYAKLAVKVGVHLQPDQELVLFSPLPAAPLARLIAEEAYAAGARDVHVEWSDDRMRRLRLQRAADAALHEASSLRGRELEERAARGSAFLHIAAPNPDLLLGIDPSRVAAASKAGSAVSQGWRKYTQSGEISWCIVSYVTPDWARKVYPELDEEEAIGRLWEALFYMARADREDPVAEWSRHLERLQERLTFLNDRRYRKLHYRAPGTSLTVGLPEGHIWHGGGLVNAQGTYFVPNVPTEEVFTVADRLLTEGTVRSTLPLNLNGRLVEEFELTFEQGKVTSFSAAKGEEALRHLLETDANAGYLGEIALVPVNSPIAETNTIYYFTGLDENASCHLALGNAYPFCLENGTSLTKEERLERGANASLIHIDFMIGSAELDIDGETADGTREPLFRQGRWV